VIRISETTSPGYNEDETPGEAEMPKGKVAARANTAAKPKKRTAFISAPLTVDTGLLADVLKEKGLEAIRVDEGVTGLSISEVIRRSISRSDYLIAIMGDKPNGNVLFTLAQRRRGGAKSDPSHSAWFIDPSPGRRRTGCPPWIAAGCRTPH
jgi:hypothetical protein